MQGSVPVHDELWVQWSRYSADPTLAPNLASFLRFLMRFCSASFAYSRASATVAAMVAAMAFQSDGCSVIGFIRRGVSVRSNKAGKAQ